MEGIDVMKTDPVAQPRLLQRRAVVTGYSLDAHRGRE
jgi:hypothetical protein